LHEEHRGRRGQRGLLILGVGEVMVCAQPLESIFISKLHLLKNTNIIFWEQPKKKKKNKKKKKKKKKTNKQKKGIAMVFGPLF
jgi:hypothetical protein